MGGKVKDLVGKTFGLWTVKYMTKKITGYGAYWHCVCECGTEREIRGSALKNRSVYSCGCKNRRILAAERFPETGSKEYYSEVIAKAADPSGLRIGSLTILNLVPKEQRMRSRDRDVICKCDCGKIIQRSVHSLKRTHSCGCLRTPNLKGKTFGRITVTSEPYKLDGVLVADYLCICGNTGSAPNTVLHRGGTTSCGVGICHYSYNPTLTEEDRVRGRKYEEYYEWRRGVYARDNYVCVVCGTKGDIQAHHILAYKAYPEHQTVLPNGITLCRPCHESFHDVYGKGDNNLMQLIEWNPLKGVLT